MPPISCISCFRQPSRPTTAPTLYSTSSPLRGESSIAGISEPFTPVELDETAKSDLLELMTQAIIYRKKTWHEKNDTIYGSNLETNAYKEAQTKLNNLIENRTLSLEIIQGEKDEYEKQKKEFGDMIGTKSIIYVIHPGTEKGEEKTKAQLAKPIPYASHKD